MITTTQPTVNVTIELQAGSGQNYDDGSIVVRTINKIVEREFVESDGNINVTSTPAGVTAGSVSITGIPIELGLTTIEVYSVNGTGTQENYNKLLVDSVDRINDSSNTISQVLF